MSSHSSEDVSTHLKKYWGIFAALLVLTGVTVGVAEFHLPIGLALLVCLVVAITKGSLVAGFFMHLIGEKKIIFWILGITILFFFVCLGLPLIVEMEKSGTNTMWSPAPEAAKTETAPAHDAAGEAGHDHGHGEPGHEHSH